MISFEGLRNCVLMQINANTNLVTPGNNFLFLLDTFIVILRKEMVCPLRYYESKMFYI